jgi:phenylacetate-coenzyme A ligase PaaK-like adenylate-forming protein
MVRRYLEKGISLSVYEINRNSFEQCLTKIAEHKPKIILALASALLHLAILAKEVGLVIEVPTFRGIVSTGELLTRADRAFIHSSVGTSWNLWSATNALRKDTKRT